MRAIGSERIFRNIAARKFLVGAGAQKAGTTWLWDYLSRHPEIAMSPIKELHYFDQHFRPDLCGKWVKEFDQRTSSAINLLAGGGYCGRFLRRSMALSRTSLVVAFPPRDAQPKSR